MKKLILAALTIMLVSAFVPTASAQQFIVATASSGCTTGK